ncbi:MAG: DedA family protein [Pelosinus sp.]|nr:DedA family protein [Pelosinus sp.]
MEQFYEAIIGYIDVWGYTAILIGMAMESACMPVPSELIFGFAGYLVFMGKLNFTYTVAAGVIGGLLGSLVAYGVGYYGGRPFIDQYGKYILLSHKHVDLAQKWFDRYGLKATFYSRLLPVVRTFISLPAGFAHVNFKKFALFTVLGSLPWTMALVYGGMLLGENWHKLETVGHNVALVVAAVLAVLGILWWKHNRGEVDAG